MWDILIKAARIIDGTGRSEFLGDIGIIHGMIADMGAHLDGEAREVIDCSRRFAASPGFVDVHAHSDFYIFRDSRLLPKLYQGVTTDISGNCGLSPAPVSERYFDLICEYGKPLSSGIKMPDAWKDFTTFAKYRKAIENLRPGINVGYLAAQGTIRMCVMGFDGSKPSKAQMSRMKGLLRECLESGARGMSSGLVYMPGFFTSKEELIALCKVVKAHSGVYATHMRNEGKGIVNALLETVDIARQSGCRANISHLKVIGKDNKPLVEKVLEIIHSARNEGIEICADQYPYQAGCTFLNAILPPPFLRQGLDHLCESLKDRGVRETIKDEILADRDPSWQNFVMACGFEGIRICSAKNTKEHIGKTIAQLADERREDPFDTAFDLLETNEGDVLSIYTFVDEESIVEIMTQPFTMVGTDGNLFDEKHNPHPRAHATFVRVLGKYVREGKRMPLETAIHKMTLLPAQCLGLSRKGQLAKGMDADMVIFDPHTVEDGATFADTSIPNKGIAYVIVNGGIAVKDHQYIGDDRGRVLM